MSALPAELTPRVPAVPGCPAPGKPTLWLGLLTQKGPNLSKIEPPDPSPLERCPVLGPCHQEGEKLPQQLGWSWHQGQGQCGASSSHLGMGSNTAPPAGKSTPMLGTRRADRLVNETLKRLSDAHHHSLTALISKTLGHRQRESAVSAK